MKKLTSRVASFLILGILSVSVLISCSKTGPQGQTGPAGPIGATGPSGPQGTAGNANVKVDTFTLTNSDWAWNSTYSFSDANGALLSYFTRYHDVTDSLITSSILNSGMVLVFFTPNQSNSAQWEPLPYSLLEFSRQFYYNYAFETFPYKVRLHFFYSSNGPTGVIPSLSTATIADCKFKIVVVSGTIGTKAPIDWNNYKQVSQYLGI